MKAAGWITALLGLWLFGDIAGLVVIGVGKVSPGIWNHIITGLVLIAAGAGASLAHRAGTAQALRWAAAAAGLWLVAARFVLGVPTVSAALWNDIIVGAFVLAFNLWAALAARRSPR